MATNLLSDRAVQSAKPRDAEYEIRDGGGLSLRVKKDGTKIWAFRYTRPDTKKQVREYLGSYPVLKLADAREAVAARRTLVAKSIDPGSATALLQDESEAPTTVGDLYNTWYDKHVSRNRSSESDKASIRSRFENYVKPRWAISPRQDTPRPTHAGDRRGSRSQQDANRKPPIGRAGPNVPLCRSA